MKGLSRTAESDWQLRLHTLLGAIWAIQVRRHTVSLRELEDSIGVSRQTIANWLVRAEQLGYVDRHGGLPRGLELLPLGKRVLLAVKRPKAKKVRNEHAGVAATI